MKSLGNSPLFYLTFCLILTVGCQVKPNVIGLPTNDYPTVGNIDRLDPLLDALIPLDAQIEVLAEGFTWTEGPLWIADGQYLLFSDIPPNKIMKWSASEGVVTYLSPSGYTGETSRAGEPGSNGLLLDKKGNLVLCQHGDRRMARMKTTINNPEPLFETIVDNYKGKRLNSPNDAIYDSKGNLYFTDPPYGLEGNMKDPSKELEFQGVFRYKKDGSLNLIADDIPRPNGIGLSPDERTLYVASSQLHPMWTKFDLNKDGEVNSQSIFYDTENPKGLGAPDGLKVDSKGYIWATGPGGVWIFTPEAKLLGKIITGQRTSNCAFDDTETYLYMTCDDYLMRIKLK